MAGARSTRSNPKRGKVFYREADFDSIVISQVFLPYNDPVPNISFGMLNTVDDEISLLIRKFNLGLTSRSCSLVLTKFCGNSVTMNRRKKIEEYLGDLSSHGTVVRLIHSHSHSHSPFTSNHAEPDQGQPSMSFLGIKRK